MSRLEKLINELCPNGVEYVKIKDYFQRLKGTPITAAKMKEIENANGEIRIFAGGKTVINANEEDIPKANITRVPAVLVQSRGVIDVVFYEKPFTFKNEMWAYTTENITTEKYLYYVLKNNIQKFRDAASGMGSLPQISLSVTEDFKIPLPPIEIQREIVRILDNFTNLTAELTAELTARQKQYEFYRDTLLTFDVHGGGTSEVQWKTLGEVCNSVSSGKNKEKKMNGKYPVYGSTGVIAYCDKYNYTDNNILLARVGANAGYVQIASGKYDVSDNALILSINNKINFKYLFYQLVKMNLRQYAKGGGQPLITAGQIKKIKIPVPPLLIQECIVKILDRFDTLCNDISKGIPAEIEARQKQYEYYRDKLLTFKEK